MNWKMIMVWCGAVGLAGCSQYPLNATLRVGDDRDRFGCIASAGYQWCAAENACVRPWELAKSRGFSLEDQAIKQYCAGQTEALYK